MRDASDGDNDDDVHRDRVHEAADRALDKDVDVFQRLRDDDDDGRAWVDRLRSGSRLRDLIDDDGNDDNDVDDVDDGRPVGDMP